VESEIGGDEAGAVPVVISNCPPLLSALLSKTLNSSTVPSLRPLPNNSPSERLALNVVGGFGSPKPVEASRGKNGPPALSP
jgi:hypothetical protein